ncbi:predicted protein [Pyrenophora tritici-repentis Pt-1C-BFP]|uniref:Uncharacterized protein n=1 Tax=Pyrenophora tritici-repentis (strain Pt-1C-BFP) TaxID=426418 RepID=B2WIK9_PYRTR|nr:uncharacterized protein PTRG_09818 [Pyrenophora tritici-repentis Pt-1C-BFP]EDU42869.1 predicted protein [Pyrenophora tritici-repentis Pt-1C-BFP]
MKHGVESDFWGFDGVAGSSWTENFCTSSACWIDAASVSVFLSFSILQRSEDLKYQRYHPMRVPKTMTEFSMRPPSPLLSLSLSLSP